jgi:two-component system, chemotaxis family, response regulator Rcp1
MQVPVDILLVEDNPADVDLTREAFEQGAFRSNLHVAVDGMEALRFLRREGHYAAVQRPDLILLDLNLPKRDGREVLAAIKQDPDLKTIPVVVLTSSAAEDGVLRCYQLHANSYVQKPANFSRFMDVVKSIETFWFTVVRLPRMS